MIMHVEVSMQTPEDIPQGRQDKPEDKEAKLLDRQKDAIRMCEVTQNDLAMVEKKYREIEDRLKLLEKRKNLSEDKKLSKQLDAKAAFTAVKEELKQAQDNVEMMKKNLAEINELLEPYNILNNKLNALSKYHGELTERKRTLEQGLAQLNIKGGSERKGSDPLKDTARKGSITEPQTGLVNAGLLKGTLRQAEIDKKLEAIRNIELQMIDVDYQRFLIIIGIADTKKLANEQAMIIQDKARLDSKKNSNPELLNDPVFKKNHEIVALKLEEIEKQMLNREKTSLLNQTIGKDDLWANTGFKQSWNRVNAKLQAIEDAQKAESEVKSEQKATTSAQSVNRLVK